MKTSLVLDIYREFERDQLAIVYNSEFTNYILGMMTNIVKDFLFEDKSMVKLRNKLSFLIIEAFQNTMRYGDHHFKEQADLSHELFILRNIDKADVIASDHAPHPIEDKKNGAPGFPGVETLYPLMLNLVKKGIVDLKTLVEKIVINPAKIFGFDKYSGIEIGNYANLAVFDFSEVRKIRADDLHSKAGWTPYEGFEAIFPKVVFVRGVRALDNGEVLVDRGFGTVAQV